MAIFPAAGFSLESGKWVALALALAAGLMVGAAVHPSPFLPALPWVAGLLAMFQPAIIYQGFTFYQDGVLAAAAAIFFASILGVFRKGDLHHLCILLAAAVMLGISKKTGLVQAVLLAPLVVLAGVTRTMSSTVQRSTLLGVVLVSFLLGFILVRWGERPNPSLPEGIRNLSILYDAVAIDGTGRGGIHGGCGEVSPHAPVMFWKRHFSATKRGDDQTFIKPPFWFTRPELDVFSDLTPDLRFGGYGPLYGTAFLLAFVPGLILFSRGNGAQAGWIWILAVCLALIPITPSWWARWFPHGWWIPFAACVGFFCGSKEWRTKFRWAAWPARLGLFALALNSLLILVFLGKGYVEAESIIRRQLALLTTFSTPVQVEIGHFAAARFWLEREKIPYTREKIPADTASMTLYRTTLRVRLGGEDLERIRREPATLRLLEKHKLLNLPAGISAAR